MEGENEFRDEGGNDTEGVINEISQLLDQIRQQTFKEALNVVQAILEQIGNASLVTAGFHVISYGLKRVQDVYNTRQECLSILEEMIFLNKVVKQCTERQTLKEGMQEEIRDATKLIMNGTLTCLTQIKSSPFSKNNIRSDLSLTAS